MAGKKARTNAPASAGAVGEEIKGQNLAQSQDEGAGKTVAENLAPEPVGQTDAAPADPVVEQVAAEAAPLPTTEPASGPDEQERGPDEAVGEPSPYPRSVRVMNNSVHAIKCRLSGLFVAAGGSAVLTLADEGHEADAFGALSDTLDRLGIAHDLLAFAPA